jgi:hypothetical protein
MFNLLRTPQKTPVINKKTRAPENPAQMYTKTVTKITAAENYF